MVLAAGPLAGSEQARIRALLIVEAADEADLRRRLAHDPWTFSGQLRTTSVDRWSVFVGGQRLATGDAAVTGDARPARQAG